MSSKRALVVDDSKSARAFLSRILERHEITVDAAESAEAAIDYLTRNRPDVIFMDHMMPGMDGFQAVQSIKNNPRTSNIPILMYTSQEGDLYLGQARALGAEGVLPKQIKQSDVTKMLFQLQLVTDRRTGQNTFMRMAAGAEMLPANESAIIVTPPPADLVPADETSATDLGLAQMLPRMSLEIRAAIDASLHRELGALRGFVATSLESHTERLHGDIAAALTPPTPAPVPDAATLLPERRSWSAAIGWTLALVAFAGAGLLGRMWWQQGAEIAALRTDLDAAYAEVETLRAREVVSAPGAAPESPVADPVAITPAGDAPDAAVAGTPGVQLVPEGGSFTPPAAAAPVVTGDAAATAPTGGTMPAAASAAQAQTPQAQ
jgi:CheY-like chemotaxis protein